MTAVIIPETQQTSTVYRDALEWSRDKPNAELLDLAAVFAYGSAGCFDDVETEAVATHLDAERLRAVKTEISRRERIATASAGAPSPHDGRFRDYADLAARIREVVDLPELFDRLGYDLKRVGSNSRRGEAEYSGACPACGGVDRLRVWSGPFGRCWCRRCQWGGDAVVVARSLDRSLGDSFYKTIEFLAEFAGLPLPKPPSSPAPAAATVKLVTLPSGAGFQPIRQGNRRAG